MTWSILNAKREFNRFAPEWNALNARLHRGHPMLDSDFVGPLIDQFATGREVLAILRRGLELEAAIVLTRNRWRWQTFLPSQTQIGPALVSDAASLRALLKMLPYSALAIDLLCQDPDYGPSFSEVDSSVHESDAHATTLSISLDGSFDDYWQARSRKLRQNLRRSLRALSDASKVPELRIRTSPSEVELALQTYAAIESSGWKGREGTAIQMRSAQGHFYADMLRRLSSRGLASVCELLVGEQVAASQLMLHNAEMLITLKTTHDERFASYSPGYLLDYLLLEREFGAKRFRFVEYYTNASQELLRWGTETRVISHQRLYCRPWVASAVRTYKRFRNRKGAMREEQPSVAMQD